MSSVEFGSKVSLDVMRARKILHIFAGVVALLLLTPAARYLVYLFPFASLVLSLYFLRKSTSAYVQLVCWLYMLTPLLRRIVDYRTGNPETIIMSAPYLATAMCIFVLIPRWKKAFNVGIAPLVSVFGAICYGAVTTLLHLFLLGMIEGMFAWIVPPLFCLFIYMERQRARELYIVFEQSMVYGTLVLGFYGLIQYFIFPVWDRAWMDLNQNVTVGQPEALQVRVFSTMNAPQVLGAFLLVGILVSYRSRLKAKLIGIPIGIMALALSMSRSAWVAMLAGSVYLCWRLPAQDRRKLILGAGACTILLLCAMELPSVNETLAPRFSSLLDIKHDDSAGVRSEVYTKLFETLARSPFGLGIGTKIEDGEAITDAEHDSSFVGLLLSFGVLGSLAYSSGLLAIVCGMLFARGGRNGAYLLPLQVVILAISVEAFVNNVLTGPNAFLTWTVLGLGLALRETPEMPQQMSSIPSLAAKLSMGLP